MRQRHDWIEIQRYFDTGNSPTRCREQFRIAYGAWAMAIRRGKLRLGDENHDGRRRHDWQAVQRYYDDGHSFYDCLRVFKFSRAAWHKAVRREEIKTRPPGKALNVLLATGKSRGNIKLRLLRAGLLENRCSECGLSEWLEQPLTIQIDHINGIRDDHRFENLRMLCPNCHSQTETYGRRSGKRATLQERPGIE